MAITSTNKDRYSNPAITFFSSLDNFGGKSVAHYVNSWFSNRLYLDIYSDGCIIQLGGLVRYWSCPSPYRTVLPGPSGVVPSMSKCKNSSNNCSSEATSEALRLNCKPVGKKQSVVRSLPVLRLFVAAVWLRANNSGWERWMSSTIPTSMHRAAS